jgi:hypothetical protein
MWNFIVGFLTGDLLTGKDQQQIGDDRHVIATLSKTAVVKVLVSIAIVPAAIVVLLFLFGVFTIIVSIFI